MSGFSFADFFASVRFRYVNSLLTFIVGIVIARSITIAERGELSYLMTVVDIALLGLGFGLSKVLLNISVRAGTYQRFMTPLVTLIAVGAFVAGILFMALHVLKPEFRGLLAIIAAYAFFRTQFSLIDARERGRLNFPAYYRYFTLERVLLLAALLALVVIGVDLRGVLLALAGTSGLTVLAYLYRRPIALAGVSWRQLGLIARRTLPVGLLNVLSSLAAFALVRLDIILIGERFGETQLGYFAIALILVTMVNGVGQSFVFVALPRLIGLRDDQADATRRPALATFAGMALLYAMLWLVGPTLITIVYGERFAPSGDILRILIFVGLATASRTLLEVRPIADNRFAALLRINLAALALKAAILIALHALDMLTLNAVMATSAAAQTATLPLLYRMRRRPTAAPPAGTRAPPSLPSGSHTPV